MQISEQRQSSSIFNNRAATCCHLSKILALLMNRTFKAALPKALTGITFERPGSPPCLPPSPTCHHSVDQQQQHGMYHPPQTPPWRPTKGGWSAHKDICIFASH